MRFAILFVSIIALFACNHKHEQHEEPAKEAKVTGVSIIQSMYEAFGEGDVDAVVAAMSPEIHWNEAENFVYADGNPYVGPDEIVEGVFARLGEEWEYWNLDSPVFQALEEDGVLVTGRYLAKHMTTGKDLNAQFAHVWKLENGKVVSFQQYTDTKQAAEVVAGE